MLEVIVGCMFSGKSEALAGRLTRGSIAGQSVFAFKPIIDDRYHANKIASHSSMTYEANTFKDFNDLRSKINFILNAGIKPDIIGIDEVQFLPIEIASYLDRLANDGIRVIVAGLDTDYLGNPFGPIPQLLAIADSSIKLTAICVAKDSNGKICGKQATKTFRIPSKDTGSLVQVGAVDSYEARCRACWKK